MGSSSLRDMFQLEVLIIHSTKSAKLLTLIGMDNTMIVQINVAMHLPLSSQLVTWLDNCAEEDPLCLKLQDVRARVSQGMPLVSPRLELGKDSVATMQQMRNFGVEGCFFENFDRK